MAKNHSFRIKVSNEEKQVIEQRAKSCGFASGASFMRHIALRFDFYEKFSSIARKIESA